MAAQKVSLWLLYKIEEKNSSNILYTKK